MSNDPNEGQAGIGAEGYSAYDAANAPVIKDGGNSPEQDGVVTEADPKSFYGGGSPNGSGHK